MAQKYVNKLPDPTEFPRLGMKTSTYQYKWFNVGKLVPV